MDGEDGATLYWLIDGAAAASAGGAVGWSLALLDAPLAAAIGGPAALLLAWFALRRVAPVRRRARLPAFELPAWSEVLPSLPADLTGKVVRLRSPPRIPYASGAREGAGGRGAGSGTVVPFVPDASAALRTALAQARPRAR